MDPLTTICGIAALITIVIAWFGPDDAFVLALLMLVGWVVTACAWQTDQLGTLPVLDLLVAVLAFIMLASQPSRWRTLFTGAAVAQLALDGLYGALGGYIFYALIYNALGFIELAVLSATGVANAWITMLRGLRHIHHAVRSASGKRRVGHSHG